MAPDSKPRWFRRRGVRIGAALVAVVLFYFWAVWPPPLWYRFAFPHETSFMAMRRHEDPVRATHRSYRPVPLAQIAPAFRRAVLIGEDNRFYQHHGFDWVEIRHAMGFPRDSFSWRAGRDWSSLMTDFARTTLSRKPMRGASTITQQLAKNLYLSSSRNPLRKLKEAFTAARLELWLPKDRILELYLNTAEMGDEIWGVEAASRHYFGVSARNLTTAQAATLAALLPFPRSSNPDHSPARMAWRRDLILQRLSGGTIVVAPEADPDAGEGTDRHPLERGGAGRSSAQHCG